MEEARMLGFLRDFQAYAVPIAIYVLILLAGVFIILLAIYFVSIYVHTRKKRYIERRTPRWRELIEELLEGKRSPEDVYLSHREHRYFRDLLIVVFFSKEPPCTEEMEELAKQRTAFEHLRKDRSCLEKIGTVYRQLGFHKDDIRELESPYWWRRAHALERLTDLKIEEAEDAVFPLLSDPRSEVRFSAAKMLAAIGSSKLVETLPRIFKESTRWSYRYLVNILYVADIPAASLKPLATSEDRDFRKAATVLLGRRWNREGIPMLKVLVDDEVKDVRREAVRSLGRIGLVEGLPVISSKADDPHPQVRAEVAKALGELGDKDALPLLERLADDTDFNVRLQAFTALSRLGAAGAAVIRKYGNKHPEMVREFLAVGSHA
jgi:HEAT repeat protein